MHIQIEQSVNNSKLYIVKKVLPVYLLSYTYLYIYYVPKIDIVSRNGDTLP